MKESIKTKIKLYLTEKRGWVKGGLIEDFIRQTDGHKASNASRRCRELEDEGVIESQYVNVPGVANKVVEYRIRNHSGDIAPIINKAKDSLIMNRRVISPEWWLRPEFQRPKEVLTQKLF